MEGSSQSVDERLREALEQIETLKQSGEEYKAAAEACNQELQHFVYAASHDLQEPLRAVTTYSQLLERRYANDEETRELTAFITSGVTRMNNLLQNLVMYSRISASTSRSNVQLKAAVQVALYKLDEQVKETSARVDYGELPTVLAHEVQMGVVFEQLLANSLLFRGSSTPEIRISCDESEVGYQVSVRDNGIGIEPRFLSQVLLPFKRLHGKEVPGNGLGLAICEKIVKAHGGRLWLESDGVKQTTAHFTLPY